jgi:hypothetical protein
LSGGILTIGAASHDGEFWEIVAPAHDKPRSRKSILS